MLNIFKSKAQKESERLFIERFEKRLEAIFREIDALILQGEFARQASTEKLENSFLRERIKQLEAYIATLEEKIIGEN